jgi:hypothetical protein
MEERKQIGGTHYEKCKIQPKDYIRANNLDFFEGNVVKYVSRHKEKEGEKDILKVIDYAIMILEDVYGTHIRYAVLPKESSDIDTNLKKKGLTPRQINDLSK